MNTVTEYGNTLEIGLTPSSDRYVLNRCTNNFEHCVGDLVNDEKNVVTLVIDVRKFSNSKSRGFANIWLNVKNLENGETATYFFGEPDREVCYDIFSVYESWVQKLDLYPIG